MTNERSAAKPSPFIGAIILALLVGAAFGQSIDFKFVNFDDNDYVFNNPVVRHGLTGKGFLWAFGFHAFNWHPVTWLSHMLDCQLYGLHPWGHHLTNVLLFGATVIGLFFFLLEMTAAFWPAFFTAALFAVHPLRAESVAWVSERKDLLSALFFVLTLLAYVRYARTGKGCGWVPLFYILGLMSKPMLVTLPLILMLLDFWPLRRNAPKTKLLLEKIPLFLFAAGDCVLTYLAQRRGIQEAGSFALLSRLENAADSCIVYLRQMIWPSGLAAFYPFPRVALPVWEPLMALLILCAVSFVCFFQRAKRPWLFVGWMWYLIMLLPVMGIIQVGRQAHADRYTLLPSIGLLIAVLWTIKNGPLWREMLSVIVVAFAGAAIWQTGFWENSYTLWQRDLAVTKNNYLAHYSLGDAYQMDNKFAEAIDEYRASLTINPSHAATHNGYGNALEKVHNLPAAIDQFRLAVQLDPNFGAAFNNLGIALRHSGAVADSIAQFQRALQLMPDNTDVRFNLAAAYVQNHDLPDAIRQYDLLLQTDPSDAQARKNLETVRAMQFQRYNAAPPVHP